MIYAELAGGTGNQMFICAFARALGLRCGGRDPAGPAGLAGRCARHTVCALGALNISPR